MAFTENSKKKLFLIIAVFCFLFLGSKTLAATCNTFPTENTAPCDVLINYTDTGHSGLKECKYQVVSQGGCLSNSSWIPFYPSCSGEGPVTFIGEVSVAAGTWDVCWYTKDNADNEDQGYKETIKIVSNPLVITTDATDIKTTQASLNGDLTDLGGASTVNVWFEWGLTTSYGNITALQQKSAIGNFTAALSGLTNNTTYHFMACASNLSGTKCGIDRPFTTTQDPNFALLPSPAAITVEKTGVSQASAISVISSNGFNSAVTLTISSGLPTNATYNFSSSPVTPPANGSIVSNLTITANNAAVGSYNLIVRGESASPALIKTTLLNLVVYEVTPPSGPSVSVDLFASPFSGTAPLNNVYLAADVGGTAVGTVNFKFHCNAPDTPATWEHSFDTVNVTVPNDAPINKTDLQGHTHSTQVLSAEIFQVFNLCNYSAAGSYTPRVKAERGSGSAEDTAQVVVSSVCARSNPIIVLSPASQSGSPGNIKTYAAGITNSDTSACGNSTFNLTYSCPANWTCSLNKSSVIITPGSNDSSAVISVTPPSGATGGNYTVSVTATNSGATSYNKTGSATYSVVSCVSGGTCSTVGDVCCTYGQSYVCQANCSANGTVCITGSECCSGFCYVDADGDRYAPASGIKKCQASVSLGTDCNDSCPTCYPGSINYTSSPDGLDQDCNGVVDNAASVSLQEVLNTLYPTNGDNCSEICARVGKFCSTNCSGYTDTRLLKCGPFAGYCPESYWYYSGCTDRSACPYLGYGGWGCSVTCCCGVTGYF